MLANLTLFASVAPMCIAADVPTTLDVPVTFKPEPNVPKPVTPNVLANATAPLAPIVAKLA